MDTHGHEECAKLGGEMIQAAIDSSRHPQLRLGAFYLGNWLTDVSQAVDPVAISSLRVKFRQAMYAVIQEVEAVSAYLPGFTQAQVGQFRNSLNEEHCRIDNAAAAIAGTTSASPLAGLIKRTFFVLGYRKFVHPDSPKTKRRMDFPSYKEIFNQRFTQYFPHEHVDRYPGDPAERGGYSKKVAVGTLTPTGTGTGQSKLTPHQYEYLVEDIRVVAGLLAEVDLHWARKTFSGRRSVSDEDVEWNKHLAKLGHAVHAVEDYFVHSNYIELALKDWPDGAKYRPDPSLRLDSGYLETPTEIVEKRLRQFDGEKLPNLSKERNVVTGYFDFVDTFFSLRHVYEGIFGEKEGDGEEGDEAEGWRRLLHSVVQAIHEQTRLDPSVSLENARKIARREVVHQAYYGKAERQSAAQELLNECPSEIREEFYEVAAQFCVRAPGAAVSMYSAFETVVEFTSHLSAPVKWIEGLLKPLMGPSLSSMIVKSISHQILRIVDNRLGRTRIGSHSLLAKDYAWHVQGLSELDRLYDLAKGLAKAIHWYILYALTRWSRVEAIPAARTFAGDETVFNTIEERLYIDWLELLECFLRNPHAVPAPPGTPWWQNIVKHGYANMQAMMSLVSAAPPPHQFRYITEAEVKQFIADAAAQNQKLEEFYNTDPAVISIRATEEYCAPMGR
jgi:hypothetical protein